MGWVYLSPANERVDIGTGGYAELVITLGREADLLDSSAPRTPSALAPGFSRSGTQGVHRRVCVKSIDTIATSCAIIRAYQAGG